MRRSELGEVSSKEELLQQHLLLLPGGWEESGSQIWAHANPRVVSTSDGHTGRPVRALKSVLPPAKAKPLR